MNEPVDQIRNELARQHGLDPESIHLTIYNPSNDFKAETDLSKLVIDHYMSRAERTLSER